MCIERITPDSAKDVYSLFDQYRVFYKKTSDIELAKSFIDDRLKNNQSVIYVAYDLGTPIGFTQLYPSYSSVSAVKYWILNDLYVQSDYRKKGIGRLLIEQAKEFCKKDNGKALFLETAKDNYTAKKLYEAIGFQLELADDLYDKYKLAIED